MADTTVYFGYGSNLWKEQMKKRCPASRYIGVARLKGYCWIINQRGYANIVQVAKDEKHSYDEEVWGLVYTLTPKDEQQLDLNEGVPVAYTKEDLEIDFWESGDDKARGTLGNSKKAKMLVYISRDMTEAAEPKHEYIYRMNKGIEDALEEGVPSEYVDKVLRKFIPKDSDEDVEEFARKQALYFEDEE